MKSRYICIEGNLGAGKTTLAKAIAQQLDSHLVLETFENNPFLQGLYNDELGSSLPAELFFLMERYEQLSSNFFSTSQLIVSDYILDKSSLFSKINLSELEWELFERIFNRVKKETPNPHALIFIEETPEEALKNIRSRGREIENSVKIDYLRKVDHAYQGYLNSNKHSFPILKITASKLRENGNDAIKETIDFLVKHHLLVV
jgi:deoxyadenosine/deoxycytidine kinase